MNLTLVVSGCIICIPVLVRWLALELRYTVYTLRDKHLQYMETTETRHMYTYIFKMYPCEMRRFSNLPIIPLIRHSFTCQFILNKYLNERFSSSRPLGLFATQRRISSLHSIGSLSDNN